MTANMPAARMTDMHVCPIHGGGPIAVPCCPTVLIGSLPAARITDLAICIGPTDPIAVGSPTVLIGKLLAARLGDATGHGGVIVQGLPTVLIGNAP
ncbi:PAAR domain-containing protein [Reyranella sp. CPCC 100927]|uniref:PAAR domain-containing protein n=1 Tax=Reyranella sp. CPCC 100927 TaxID=2599616 RepID=UPI0021059313|nr:PAAR domain-containing protein [Reyranella sp. CPCC 100927]